MPLHGRMTDINNENYDNEKEISELVALGLSIFCNTKDSLNLSCSIKSSKKSVNRKSVSKCNEKRESAQFNSKSKYNLRNKTFDDVSRLKKQLDGIYLGE